MQRLDDVLSPINWQKDRSSMTLRLETVGIHVLEVLDKMRLAGGWIFTKIGTVFEDAGRTPKPEQNIGKRPLSEVRGQRNARLLRSESSGCRGLLEGRPLLLPECPSLVGRKLDQWGNLGRCAYSARVGHAGRLDQIERETQGRTEGGRKERKMSTREREIDYKPPLEGRRVPAGRPAVGVFHLGGAPLSPYQAVPEPNAGRGPIPRAP